MNIIVAVENSSKQPEENTQALLDHLSIVYVATDESETSGELGAYSFCVGRAQSRVHRVLAHLQNIEASNLPAAWLGFPESVFGSFKD